MNFVYLYIVALFLGFTHSFEIDHLAAVSNLMFRNKKQSILIKSGILWGVGHTTSILVIGLLTVILTVQINDSIYRYLESGVGLMLIILGISKITKLFKKTTDEVDSHTHHLAYKIGIVHGLAGSGSVVALSVTATHSFVQGLVYLLLFGLGSIVGMFLVSYLFSYLFHKKASNTMRWLRVGAFVSSFLCVFLGGYILYNNLLQIT
ncbi:MAG: sulfite exporter TauE/SafE family protein [Alphaproteobacteria bacterium]|nr:sulfite exporter TauE/SafE family protein [Alphaproteobacteria bacterium]